MLKWAANEKNVVCSSEVGELRVGVLFGKSDLHLFHFPFGDFMMYCRSELNKSVQSKSPCLVPRSRWKCLLLTSVCRDQIFEYATNAKTTATTRGQNLRSNSKIKVNLRDLVTDRQRERQRETERHTDAARIFSSCKLMSKMPKSGVIDRDLNPAVFMRSTC